MILEIADIRIHPGQNAAFEEAIGQATQVVLPKAKGVHGFILMGRVLDEANVAVQMCAAQLQQALAAD